MQNFPSREELLGRLDPASLAHNMRRLFGPEIEPPAKFVTFDLETTATDPHAGVIWQIGMCRHENGVPIEGETHGRAMYLARSETVLLSNTFEIGRRAEKIAAEFGVPAAEARGLATEDFLETQRLLGVPPADALAFMAQVLTEHIAEGYPIVGHNLISFDCPFFETECQRHGIDFKFPDEGVLDTGMIIKAAKLGRRMLDTESSRRFFSSVGNVKARGVFYAIERFCIPYWNMVERYGVNLKDAHDAGYDCWLTGIVMNELIADARAAGAT